VKPSLVSNGHRSSASLFRSLPNLLHLELHQAACIRSRQRILVDFVFLSLRSVAILRCFVHLEYLRYAVLCTVVAIEFLLRKKLTTKLLFLENLPMINGSIDFERL